MPLAIPLGPTFRAVLSLALLCAAPFAGTGAHAAAQDGPSPDEEAVRQAVLDYVEAVYDATPGRIERSVSAELTKIGWYRARDAAEYTASPMTYEELLETARTWNADGRDLSGAPRLITVFDVLDRVASARLVAAWGIDYFHLAKDDEGRWKIRHVVWQSHTPETAAAARAAMERGAGAAPAP